MNRLNRILPVLPALGFMVGMTACGGSAIDSQTDAAELERRDASLLVTPSLSLSNLFSEAVASRIRVDEISINLTEARMLGSDLRIPPEGVALLSADRLIRSSGANAPAIDFRFPEYLLEDRELTVFLRVGRSEALDGASVVVRGRYLPPNKRSSGSNQKATDPDLDPMDDPSRISAPKTPIGPHNCATDPDLDPMSCDTAGTGGSTKVDQKTAGVAFELRDEQVVDLLATLDSDSSLEVILGVPAERWFTPSVLDRFEAAWTATKSSGDLNEAIGTTVIVNVEDAVDTDDANKVGSRGANGYDLENR